VKYFSSSPQNQSLQNVSVRKAKGRGLMQAPSPATYQQHIPIYCDENTRASSEVRALVHYLGNVEKLMLGLSIIFLCPPSKKRGYIALHMLVCL